MNLDHFGMDTITLTMLDGRTTKLWDAPVQTAALRWGI
jgi:dihydroxyacetone kinase